MLDKKRYKNNQVVYELENDILTYYYENGVLKAQGGFYNNKMQNTWKFYRKTGELWQEGFFIDDVQDGKWIVYKITGEIEKEKYFENGKQQKNKHNK